ncbi:MAG: response regulator [Leptolyngbya sp. SIO1E4]|nr:response regulator [Leptolyngbya sp. SIO1E4]
MTEVLRILIVDDDEVDRMAIRRHLAKTHFTTEITEAGDADTALEYLTQEQYSCVFLDYRLPDTDGISLVKQLRLEGFLVPIIVLTGQGDEQIAVDLMKAGASDYLTKARLSHDTLASLIRSAIKVYRAEQRIRAAQEQLRQTNALLKQQNHELEDQRRQIEQQNLKLQEANQLKSEFLATVTHELRTPLNAIMGFSQILKSQSKGPLTPYQIEMVSRIFTNGESLLNLVNDILDMSVIEAHRLELLPNHFDLSHLVRITLAELKPLAEKKGLDIQVSINVENTEVYNDEYRLKQILVNLISNAIKFTDRGRVVICVTAPASNGIEIRIEDTGIGIEANQLDHIFKPFRQGDQTTTRRHSGTGLGLAITHSLVSMMAGIITVESQVGEGTTFQVQIPRSILKVNPEPRQELHASP